MKIVTVLIFSSSSKNYDLIPLLWCQQTFFKRKVCIIIDAKMVNFYAYKTSVCEQWWYNNTYCLTLEPCTVWVRIDAGEGRSYWSWIVTMNFLPIFNIRSLIEWQALLHVFATTTNPPPPGVFILWLSHIHDKVISMIKSHSSTLNEKYGSLLSCTFTMLFVFEANFKNRFVDWHVKIIR